MIKIGKHYYKNFWALILVVVFKKPNIIMPKGWNKQIEPLAPMNEIDNHEEYKW